MPAFGMGAVQPAQEQQVIESSTPWMAAADGNLPLLQRSLTALNLSINAADENGYTLLQAAASYGQLQVLQWILSHNNHNNSNDTNNQQEPSSSSSPGAVVIDVNAVDNEGDSALHYAGTVEAAKLLVEVGHISTAIQNKEGKTALHSKQEELNEMMEEDEEDDDNEDAENLRKQIQYLSTLPSTL